MKVSKLVMAGLGTLAGIVAGFLYPTSTNRPAPGQADAGSASSGAVGGTSDGGSMSGSASDSGSSARSGSSSGSDSSSSSSDGSSSSGSGSGSSAQGSSSGSGSTTARSGTYTGDVVQTRWGPVQVEITVKGGKITAAQAVEYPDGNGRDQQINAYALPLLAQEVVQAQSATIDAISGATVTSDGYISSLQSAVDQAFQA